MERDKTGVMEPAFKNACLLGHEGLKHWEIGPRSLIEREKSLSFLKEMYCRLTWQRKVAAAKRFVAAREQTTFRTNELGFLEFIVGGHTREQK